MENTSLTLAQVQQTYGTKYNLLIPQATDVQINPFYSYRVEVVPVDTSDNTGDCFKVGSVNGGTDRNGKTIWLDTFSLTKPLLNKMALAAGIQFNPRETYGERIDQYTYRAHAQGAMKKADGTARVEADQKEICLLDEEDRFKIEFADKADKGITDDKQAKAAAELYKGTWIDATNKWGKNCKAFLVDPSERQKYIDRSVLANMTLLRKTWAEKAMTGAKLRVIRALLGVKGTYTKEELNKGFAIPAVVFAPDYNDPSVRQMMLQQGMNSINNMFGAPQIPIKTVNFDTETTFDANNLSDTEIAAYQSDGEYEEDYEQPVVIHEPVQVSQPVVQTPSNQDEYSCDGCGKTIPENVWKYSYDKFGKPLCMSCQRANRK